MRELAFEGINISIKLNTKLSILRSLRIHHLKLVIIGVIAASDKLCTYFTYIKPVQ